jgi:predicted nucleotidyltransferase
MQKENILNYLTEIKSDLRQKGIEKIGLFGSFAKDEASPFSDIDIAIQLQKEYLKKNDVWEYFNLIENIKEKLLKKFSRKVDVYDLDSTGNIRNTISRDVIYV